MIDKNHPVCPHLGEKFKVTESITVKNQNLKLFDAFGCLRCIEKCSKVCRKGFKKFYNRKKRKRLEKPRSMKDLPDSDSE